MGEPPTDRLVSFEEDYAPTLVTGGEIVSRVVEFDG
jgi:hypothetical protein